MGACSLPVLMSCSIRSNHPKSESLIANMPSYWSISREHCLFCSSEGPSEPGWITFALLFSLSVLFCVSSSIFLSITENYRWLGAAGLTPISVGRGDRKVRVLLEKLPTRTRVCPSSGTCRERAILILEVPCTSFHPSRILGLPEFCS